MSQKRWLNAAALFQEKKAQAVQESITNQVGQAVADPQEKHATRVQAATYELKRFLSSEDGQDARQLLAASGRHIVVAEEREGGMGVVYFLDGNGLQQSVEAMGMWVAYAQQENVPKPKCSPVDAEEVAALAIRQGAKPHQIVENICNKLDQIADEVL